MKKFVVIFTIFFITISSFYIYAGKREDREKLYLSALTERNPELKLQKLEEYYNKFGKKKKYQTPTLFIQLVETSLKLKKYDKLLNYADIALQYKKLSDTERSNIKLDKAYYYIYGKKDLKTAESLADEVIVFAKSKKDKNLNADALRIKVIILESSSKDVETIKKALKTSIEIYNIDHSLKSAHFVFYFSKKLYDEFSLYDEAINALKKICADNRAMAGHLEQLSLWYMADGLNSKAIEYMKPSYMRKKNSKKAYFIGKLMCETDLEKAFQYLGEAYVLSNEPYATKAMDLLKIEYKKELKQKLNQEIEGEQEDVKEPEEEEIEAGIKKIIEEAKVRLDRY
jgi:tetratricopeptide (TPR) repeat protein